MFLSLTYLYAWFLKCRCFYEFSLSSFALFFPSEYVGAPFSSGQGIEPLGIRILKALPCCKMQRFGR